MIYCVYFVPREGIHPCVSLDIYDQLWPIMHASLRKLGHDLVHITDMHTPSWGDSVFRVDVDPATTVHSRDVAWLAYLESLPDGEQACMIEPDTLMLRDIPPIAEGFDMVLLKRPKGIPGWFKLATRQATPFFRDIVAQYDKIPLEMRVFHGDIVAMHRACGLAESPLVAAIPSSAHGVRIEVRDWMLYGFRKTRNQYFLQFKGTSKKDMLEYEDAL